MSQATPGAVQRSVEDLLWPLPPMCGVLGVALAWHIPNPSAAGPAACEVMRQQLVQWKLDPVAIGAAELLITELIDSTVSHGAGPLFLEISLASGELGIAIREASDSGWARPESAVYDRGLQIAEGLAEELTVQAVPHGRGYAYTACLAVHRSPSPLESPIPSEASRKGLKQAARVHQARAPHRVPPARHDRDQLFRHRSAEAPRDWFLTQAEIHVIRLGARASPSKAYQGEFSTGSQAELARRTRREFPYCRFLPCRRSHCEMKALEGWDRPLRRPAEGFSVEAPKSSA
ncbi:ATP-binding protein [Streptomyces sp. NPDC002659]|uniref:ATP-binding protein n=1 Tax=Streptomyces sp. NPDC002659 TaxID=3364656 RepID=UPI0036C30EB4